MKQQYITKPIRCYEDVLHQDYWHDFIDIKQHQDYIKNPEKGLVDLGIIIFYVYQTYLYSDFYEIFQKKPDIKDQNLFCALMDEHTLLRLNFMGKLSVWSIHSDEEYIIISEEQLQKQGTINQAIKIVKRMLVNVDFHSKAWTLYIQRLSQCQRPTLINEEWVELEQNMFFRGVKVRSLLFNHLWIYYLLQPFLTQTSRWISDLIKKEKVPFEFLWECDLSLFGDVDAFIFDISNCEDDDGLFYYNKSQMISLYNIRELFYYNNKKLLFDVSKLYY